METYIKKAEEVESVNASFIPQLLDAILGDYNRNVAQARDAEVLNVMATITLRMAVRRGYYIIHNPDQTSESIDPTNPRCSRRSV